MDTADRRRNNNQMETDVAECRGAWTSRGAVATDHSRLRVMIKKLMMMMMMMIMMIMRIIFDTSVNTQQYAQPVTAGVHGLSSRNCQLEAVEWAWTDETHNNNEHVYSQRMQTRIEHLKTDKQTNFTTRTWYNIHKELIVLSIFSCTNSIIVILNSTAQLAQTVRMSKNARGTIRTV